MTFYVKRPGQREGQPIGEPDNYYEHGTTDALEDEWSIYLNHQCDAWDIASGDQQTALAEAKVFRADLERAIAVLEPDPAAEQAATDVAVPRVAFDLLVELAEYTRVGGQTTTTGLRAIEALDAAGLLPRGEIA